MSKRSFKDFNIESVNGGNSSRPTKQTRTTVSSDDDAAVFDEQPLDVANQGQPAASKRVDAAKFNSPAITNQLVSLQASTNETVDDPDLEPSGRRLRSRITSTYDGSQGWSNFSGLSDDDFLAIGSGRSSAINSQLDKLDDDESSNAGQVGPLTGPHTQQAAPSQLTGVPAAAGPSSASSLSHAGGQFYAPPWATGAPQGFCQPVPAPVVPSNQQQQVQTPANASHNNNPAYERLHRPFHGFPRQQFPWPNGDVRQEWVARVEHGIREMRRAEPRLDEARAVDFRHDRTRTPRHVQLFNDLVDFEENWMTDSEYCEAVHGRFADRDARDIELTRYGFFVGQPCNTVTKAITRYGTRIADYHAGRPVNPMTGRTSRRTIKAGPPNANKGKVLGKKPDDKPKGGKRARRGTSVGPSVSDSRPADTTASTSPAQSPAPLKRRRRQQSTRQDAAEGETPDDAGELGDEYIEFVRTRSGIRRRSPRPTEASDVQALPESLYPPLASAAQAIGPYPALGPPDMAAEGESYPLPNLAHWLPASELDDDLLAPLPAQTAEEQRTPLDWTNFQGRNYYDPDEAREEDEALPADPSAYDQSLPVPVIQAMTQAVADYAEPQFAIDPLLENENANHAAGALEQAGLLPAQIEAPVHDARFEPLVNTSAEYGFAASGHDDDAQQHEPEDLLGLSVEDARISVRAAEEFDNFFEFDRPGLLDGDARSPES